MPTERERLRTTRVELLAPAGLVVEAKKRVAGWTVEAIGRQIVWSGGSAPAGSVTVFRFTALATSAGTYPLVVRQSYSDGSVVVWSGREGPRVVVEDGGWSTWALATIAGVALLLVLAGAVFAWGRRWLGSEE